MSRVSDFHNGEQSVHRNSHDILFRFLGFGDVKITIVIENQTFVMFAHLFTISEKEYQLRPRNVVKLQCLRWLDTVFESEHLPRLSVNYVAINKDLEKLTPQLY